MFNEMKQNDVEILLSRCGQYLKELECVIHPNSDIVRIVKKYCPNLEILKLGSHTIYQNNLIEAFNNMDKLNDLSLYLLEYEVGSDSIDFTKILSSIRCGIEKIELHIEGHRYRYEWLQIFTNSGTKLVSFFLYFTFIICSIYTQDTAECNYQSSLIIIQYIQLQC